MADIAPPQQHPKGKKGTQLFSQAAEKELRPLFDGGNAMASGFSVVADELRIIGHAITWRLNGPYEHTSPPELSEEERQVLRILFNEVCCQVRACQFGAKSILIEVREPYSCADGRMQLPSAYFRLVKDAVVAFIAELQHSPTELEVVTGAPASSASGLLSQMQAIP